MSDNQFATLGLKESIVRAISDLGFTKPSQIQEQSIPVTLSGADLIGQAQTGTGKTAAYSLPILTKMSDKKGIKALICIITELSNGYYKCQTKECINSIQYELPNFQRF